MTDETKKLFDAPWIRCRIEIEGKMQPCVSARTNHTVAISFDEKDANRLARLPELYDTLMDEAIEKCNECLHENLRMGRIPFTGKYDFVEAGCPFKDEECHTASHLNLLKKVSDGE